MKHIYIEMLYFILNVGRTRQTMAFRQQFGHLCFVLGNGRFVAILFVNTSSPHLCLKPQDLV